MINQSKIDKNIPIPLYYQLKTILNQAIDDGTYQIDEAIPTEAQLSEMYHISRTTVRQAIMELVQEGRLYRLKSKGTFVANPKVDQEFMLKLQSFNEEIQNNGQTPSTQVLALEVAQIPEKFAEEANLPLHTKAICLYRKRLANDLPIVRVKTYLLYDQCKFVLTHDFEKESLYDILGENDKTRITRVVRTCQAINACPEDVKVLNMKASMPVHHFSTFGYNSQNEIIEYSLAYYRGDKNIFRVEINL